MKKNWNSPELKNLSVECTHADRCPVVTARGVITDCIPCGFNEHNYRCDECGGCKHPDYKTGCFEIWPNYGACTCKQGS